MRQSTLRLCWLGLAIYCACWSGYAAATDELELYTENNPPHNYLADDGKTVIGTVSLVVQTAFRKADVPYRITLTDWARALNMAMRQSNACVFSTARLSERESAFQWLGPVAQSAWYLWGLPGKAKVTSLDEVRGKIICAKNSDAPGRFLASNGQNVLPAQSNEICVQHVLRGEAAYLTTNLFQTKQTLDKMGLPGQIVPVFEYQKTDLYLACNLAVPKDTMDRLRMALQPVSPH